MLWPGSMFVAGTAVACANVTSASVMNLFALRPQVLPAVFATSLLLFVPFCSAAATRISQPRSLERYDTVEKLIILFAVIIGAVRAAAYSVDGFQPGVDAIVSDDYWHFQEISSLVNTPHYPPVASFFSEKFLHFYYAPWMLPATLSVIFEWLFERPHIKAAYGLACVLLNASSMVLILGFARAICPSTPRLRLFVLILVLTGAVADGAFVLSNLPQSPPLAHAEWWQTKFLINAQFSTISTLLIWVPHHLFSAAVMLAAAVIYSGATRGGRGSLPAMVVIGALLSSSLYSSVFVFIGGLFALLPLLFIKTRPANVLVAAAVSVIISLPLLYIYVNSDSTGGWRFFAPFLAYSEWFGFLWTGALGTVVALVFVALEVGLMAGMALVCNLGRQQKALVAMSTAFLASTAVVSYSGYNNYAMRGAIIPTVVLGTIIAATIDTGKLTKWNNRMLVSRIGIYTIIALAFVAQLNESLSFIEKAIRATMVGHGGPACRRAISEMNNDRIGIPDTYKLFEVCNSPYAVYLLERPFRKSELNESDHELLGRGTFQFSTFWRRY